MVSNKKLCAGCDTLKIIWKNSEGKRYCQSCWLRIQKTVTGKRKPTKKRNAIPSRSSKKSLQDAEYTVLRKAFLLANLLCQAHIPGICAVQSTDVHHCKGRGKYYLDTSTWLAVCRKCHNWIDANPTVAIDRGWSLKRNADGK